jgi:DNA polymerase I-like protein with 3'-5' exonuclease and polymerase domains
VNVPKAEDKVFFGKEMRALFTVPEGKKLVGFDLCALEDRVAGHYTAPYDGGEYARLLLEGDPQQKTADLFETTRHKGKTCNHALKYGAQPKKIASILGVDESVAQGYHAMWWDKHPSLKALKTAVEASLRNRGQLTGRGKLTLGAFVKGLDGRKIFVRSTHSILNALVQSAGSIVNKLVTIYIAEEVEQAWIDAHFVGNFHDESQAEVAEGDVEEYGNAAHRAVARVNEFFKLNIPMAGEVKVGNNWKETH